MILKNKLLVEELRIIIIFSMKHGVEITIKRMHYSNVF